MSRAVKIWLIVAASLILAGAIMFGGAMMGIDWDFTKLSTKKYETVSFSPDGEFKNISVDITTANLKILPAEGECVQVDCRDVSDIKYDVRVTGDTLVIDSEDTRKWYQHIRLLEIGAEFPEVTVYLPAGEYGDLTVDGGTGDVEVAKAISIGNIDIDVGTGDVKSLASADSVKIETTTGDIFIDGVCVNSLQLSITTGKVQATDVICQGTIGVEVTSGDVKLKRVSCSSFESAGGTGDVYMEGLIVSRKLFVKRTSGDVKFDSCDASEIEVVTTTGDIGGSLLSGKTFEAGSTTGDVRVPSDSEGGRCVAKTTTGKIIFERKN